jgi:UDP-glucose 4-epimerase
LVSEEEANRTVERGDYYAIMPMLPELRDMDASEPIALTKEYSSADEVLDFTGTADLLKKEGLTLDDLDSSQGGELLR